MKTHHCLDGVERLTQYQSKIDRTIFDIQLTTTITHGHGVASKASAKYPEGTIALQYPFFKSLGLDLSHCFGGTLNLSISPKSYSIINPGFRFNEVDWFPARGQTENFLICDCAIKSNYGYVLGYVYQPDPQTKIEHFDNPNALQIITPYIDDLKDSQPVNLLIKSQQIEIL